MMWVKKSVILVLRKGRKCIRLGCAVWAHALVFKVIPFVLQLFCADALTKLRELESESVHCIVTSPPYWGLRDYGVDGQLGLERTPEEYVQHMVEVFRECRRVLHQRGNLWINLGDSWAGSGKGAWNTDEVQKEDYVPGITGAKIKSEWPGLKSKDLVMIPAQVALALRTDGWYLRQCNIWSKPNGMPESVRDRTTISHEYVFHLTRSRDYFYDADAVSLQPAESTEKRLAQNVELQIGSERANAGGKTNGNMKAVKKQRGHSRRHDGFNDRWDAMSKDEQQQNGANLRSVWTIAPAQYKEAHYAVMPKLLARICILAGSQVGDTVLDPFAGTGTTLAVALESGRNAIGIELNPANIALIEKRLQRTDLTQPLL